jgi:cytochrome P450
MRDTQAMGTCPYDPLSAAHRADPAAAFRVLRAEHPVLHDEAHDLWVITRHADVLAAAKDTESFSNATSASGQIRLCDAALAIVRQGPPPVDTLLTLDPPAHTENRRIVNEAFKPSRVAAMEPMVRAIASELADSLDTGQPVDFMTAMAVPLPMRVISRVLGVPEAEFPTFKAWSDEIAAGLSADLTDDEQVRSARARLEFYRYVIEACAQRRRAPADDVLSDLANLRRADGTTLSDAELCSITVQLLVAGNETSTNLLGSVLWHVERAGWWKHLVADPALGPTVVEETLRLESPVQALYRRTTTPVTVAGTTIPAGARVHLVWASANRDPEPWPEPDTFDRWRAWRARSASRNSWPGTRP